MEPIQFWHEHCTKAFNGDKKASDFILFFEGCKQLDDQNYYWKTQEYQTQLTQVGCLQEPDERFTLSTTAYQALTVLKRQARTQWHADRQQKLKAHLQHTLDYINPLLNISLDQRLALVREFMRQHRTDVGSIPFIRGMVGLLKAQAASRHYLVDWHMSEFILTQNDEEAIEAYVRLLRGVLGLQLVYQDEAIVSMEDEVRLIWRMNADIDPVYVQKILKCLTQDRPDSHPPSSLNHYEVTAIPRLPLGRHRYLMEWIYYIISQYLLFLH